MHFEVIVYPVEGNEYNKRTLGKHFEIIVYPVYPVHPFLHTLPLPCRVSAKNQSLFCQGALYLLRTPFHTHRTPPCKQSSPLLSCSLCQRLSQNCHSNVINTETATERQQWNNKSKREKGPTTQETRKTFQFLSWKLDFCQQLPKNCLVSFVLHWKTLRWKGGKAQLYMFDLYIFLLQLVENLYSLSLSGGQARIISIVLTFFQVENIKNWSASN